MDIILASASPRRKELLSLIIKEYAVHTADTDESTAETTPEKIVMDISRKKAFAVRDNFEGDLYISADTLVFCDNKPLGKPSDEKEACEMLKKLSGRSHEVFTGFCLLKKDGSFFSGSEKTVVSFAPLSDKEITDYIKTGDPLDKAGAYGIQGYASRFISGIDGCYFNVVGLPVHAIYNALKSFCPSAL